MSAKFLVTTGLILGSLVGGIVPVFFGAGALSFISILGSGIGSILGIYIGFKISNF